MKSLSILFPFLLLLGCSETITGKKECSKCKPKILSIRRSGPLSVEMKTPKSTSAQEKEVTFKSRTFLEPEEAIRDFPYETITLQRLNRFIGPFEYNYFKDIQIVLDKDGAEWCYNNYFQSVPNKNLYARYYRYSRSQGKHIVPTTNTPGSDGAPPRPGAQTDNIPDSQNAQGVLLELKSIHYSSRFGGSVKLLFEMIEEYYYEFRFEPYLYDLSFLEVSIYVVPLADSLNPRLRTSSEGYTYYPQPTAGGVFMEYKPQIKAAYVLNYPDTELGEIPSPPSDDTGTWQPPEPTGCSLVPEYQLAKASQKLDESLAKWQVIHKSDVAASYYPSDLGAIGAEAISFVYGFLHTLHNESIPNALMIPTRITIGDNTFELQTVEGEFYFQISCRVTDITNEYATVTSHDTSARFLLNWTHDLMSPDESWLRVEAATSTGARLAHSAELVENAKTRWVSIGMWAWNQVKDLNPEDIGDSEHPGELMLRVNVVNPSIGEHKTPLYEDDPFAVTNWLPCLPDPIPLDWYIPVFRSTGKRSIEDFYNEIMSGVISDSRYGLQTVCVSHHGEYTLDFSVQLFVFTKIREP
jgi:hypothetical protein